MLQSTALLQFWNFLQYLHQTKTEVGLTSKSESNPGHPFSSHYPCNPLTVMNTSNILPEANAPITYLTVQHLATHVPKSCRLQFCLVLTCCPSPEALSLL